MNLWKFFYGVNPKFIAILNVFALVTAKREEQSMAEIEP